MGLFWKLKRMMNKGSSSGWFEFLGKQEWRLAPNNSAVSDVLFFDGVKDSGKENWTAENLMKAIKNWDFYKNVETFKEAGYGTGESYLKLYKAKYAKNLEDMKRAIEANEAGEEEDPDADEGKLCFEMDFLFAKFAMCLKTESDYWYEADYSGERSQYPYLDIFSALGKEANRILMSSLILDPEGTFEGKAPYIRLLKGVLKAYSSHKGDPNWSTTIEKLFHGCAKYERGTSLLSAAYHVKNDGTPYGEEICYGGGDFYSILFPASKSLPDPYLSHKAREDGANRKAYEQYDLLHDISDSYEWSSHCYGKYLSDSLRSPFVREAVEEGYVKYFVDLALKNVLLNEEYWNGSKQDEIWKYVNTAKEEAYKEMIDRFNGKRQR